MIKKVIAILILAASFLAPVNRLDVAKLEPVETVAVTLTNGRVRLLTDTGTVGEGQTPAEALQDLKNNTHLVIYLDTARYLLIQKGAQEAAVQISQALSGSVLVGEYTGAELSEAAQYQHLHGKMTKLSRWLQDIGKQIP